MGKYSYKILEKSEQKILSLNDVKNYARITEDSDDNLLLILIGSAIEMAENFMRISLTPKLVEFEVCDMSTNAPLPLLPGIEVIRASLNDEELDLEKFSINNGNLVISGLEEKGVMKIIYRAGYINPREIPAQVVQGILHHISAMYDARGSGDIALNQIYQFYMPYRRILI